MASWHDVRRLALALPGASEERSSEGRCAWIVNKKFFAWERPLRRSDLAALGDRAPSGPILGIRTDDLEMKEVLLRSDPAVFFTTPHFDGYPAVLIRLTKISRKKLQDVLVEAWLARAPKRAADAFLRNQEQAKARGKRLR
ncbi:MAG: MmcQ/YjbR family DNA-binding protein [Candidatus Eremiobacteraeota bacterium]|nr:MmcQ/YjbR family DNA-binding protein [Candidatus Eremiobacteraeota bacterium]MBV8374011.1 MmcQ/YjbR family DNA-binding protein [Candidatus Eremiobacteraeota bacterium]